jgi:uroporphyrinogen-III synthase
VIRVLVTRPQPGASRTAARLQTLGYAPIVMPLSEIIGLNPTLGTRNFDAVVATSAQSFLHLPRDIAALLAHVPTHVAGPITATAAKNAGFRDVRTGGRNAAALLSYLEFAIQPSQKVLYICGKVRRAQLEQTLSSRGIHFTVLEAYDTNLVSYTTDKLKQIADAPFDAVLLTSVTGSDAMVQLSALPNISYVFEKSLFICLSDRIAECLYSMPDPKICVCETPDESAMIALLLHHCQVETRD